MCSEDNCAEMDYLALSCSSSEFDDQEHRQEIILPYQFEPEEKEVAVATDLEVEDSTNEKDVEDEERLNGNHW